MEKHLGGASFGLWVSESRGALRPEQFLFGQGDHAPDHMSSHCSAFS